MGDVSLNGWPVLDYGDSRLATGIVPGTTRKITCNRAALPVFLHFYAAWHKEMPARLKLNKGPLDSWEMRQARNANAFSNHASGTACDARYDVLLADNQRHMTDQEQAILKRILSRYVTKDGHWILGNGWTWNKVDEMHTELNQSWEYGAKRNTTAADVAEIIRRLGIKPNGTTTLIKQIIKPKPAPAPAPQPAPPVAPSTVHVSKVQPGMSNAEVGVVQKALKTLGLYLGVVDGKFGPRTVSAYAAWQRKLGYSGADADGKPGIKSLTALGQRYKFIVAN